MHRLHALGHHNRTGANQFQQPGGHPMHQLSRQRAAATTTARIRRMCCGIRCASTAGPALTLLNGVVYIVLCLARRQHAVSRLVLWLQRHQVSQQRPASITHSQRRPRRLLGRRRRPHRGCRRATCISRPATARSMAAPPSSAANDYAMSLMKFSTTNGLALVDYFAPSNAVTLSGGDQDLGSGAPIILPDSAGSAAPSASGRGRRQDLADLSGGPRQHGPFQRHHRQQSNRAAIQRRRGRRPGHDPGLFQQHALCLST